MNDLQIFSNPEFGSVRTLEIEGELWWVLADVCKILDIVNPTKVANRLDEDERSIFELGRQGKTNIINESGLYNVIIRSDKPNAKAFRKWITSEVIPSIRKTGGYGIPQMSQSELILKIAQNNLQLEKRIAETENQTKAVSERLDNALDVFTQPVAEDWKDETNRIINRMIEEYNLNYGVFRRKLYDELEQIYTYQGLIPIVAHVDRYMTPFRDFGIPGRLAELPVLVQANASFFLKKNHLERIIALKVINVN